MICVLHYKQKLRWSILKEDIEGKYVTSLAAVLDQALYWKQGIDIGWR